MNAQMGKQAFMAETATSQRPDYLREQFMIAFGETFSFLRDEEKSVLVHNGSYEVYDEGDIVIEEGSRTKAIYLISRGELVVEHRSTNEEGWVDRIEIARLGVGSVLGEMSYLDQQGASATVAATMPTEVLTIYEEQIEKLVDTFSGFDGRFYRSLATILSRRLRVNNTKFNWQNKTDEADDSAKDEDVSAGLKMFFIDDDAEFVEFSKLSMEARGHSVMSSVSPIFAINELLSLKPDCVLIDLIMSGMNGLEVCQELRKHPRLDDTKIIIISAKNTKLWRDKAMRAGADGFITKRQDVDKFIAEIEEIANNSDPTATHRRGSIELVAV